MVVLRCPVGRPIRIHGKLFQLPGQFCQGASSIFNRFYLNFQCTIQRQIHRLIGNQGLAVKMRFQRRHTKELIPLARHLPEIIASSVSAALTLRWRRLTLRAD